MENEFDHLQCCRYYISRTLNSDFDRYFKIDVKSGEVKTQKFLDRELLETHTVKVLAVDNGNFVAIIAFNIFIRPDFIT